MSPADLVEVWAVGLGRLLGGQPRKLAGCSPSHRQHFGFWSMGLTQSFARWSPAHFTHLGARVKEALTSETLGRAYFGLSASTLPFMYQCQ
ncbi:hypothetical protein TNCV_229851 [Trichonephila clavipes]|nr:hypothetical protein TNCV_229851 [Trichonephila clavipes]